MFAVFDLDDTLRNSSHRRHFIIPPGQVYVEYTAINPPGDFKPDWDAFFAASIDDPPIAAGMDLLKALYHAGHEIEIWTAAREDYRAETLDWLARNGVPDGLLTHMRPRDNYTKTVLLKEAWLLAHKPDIIFDDHIGICQMARRHGVYACAVGDNAY